jgi:hypothetical protein
LIESLYVERFSLMWPVVMPDQAIEVPLQSVRFTVSEPIGCQKMGQLNPIIDGVALLQGLSSITVSSNRKSGCD